MKLKKLDYDLTVCKVAAITDIDLKTDFFFIGKNDEEISLVCLTDDTPQYTTAREDDWKGFRIQGILDFTLIGILSKLSKILADNEIGIFAVSTYNTDYILVKKENFHKAIDVLSAAESFCFLIIFIKPYHFYFPLIFFVIPFLHVISLLSKRGSINLIIPYLCFMILFFCRVFLIVILFGRYLHTPFSKLRAS